MYKIEQWESRYEVNSSGDPYTPGRQQKIRSTPLDYVRSKVHGRQLGTGMRRLKATAGDRMMEVFGIFHKFLEIAADAGRGRRGHLLNSDSLDDPACAEDLAFILNITQEQIEYALTVLCDLGWMSDNVEKLPELRESPGTTESSGDSPPLNNETETEPNRNEQNETQAKGMPAVVKKFSEMLDDAIVEKESSKDSDLIKGDDSDSDSEVREWGIELRKQMQLFLLNLREILPLQWTSSDHACFRNLATALAAKEDIKVFDKALAIAKECRENGGDNPKQAFVYRVQKHFDIKLNAPWRSNEGKRKQTIKDAKIK